VWSSDPDGAKYEAFSDAVGGSAYWRAINGEYGVGPATSGPANHVRISTPPPATISDDDLDVLVANSVGSAWPAPTAGTIYTVYLDPKTTLMEDGGDGCAQIGRNSGEDGRRGSGLVCMPNLRRS
jgi:hypothetical protein